MKEGRAFAERGQGINMGSDFRLIHYYLDLALRRPLIWLMPALVVLAIGVTYVVNMPKTYYSEAVIVVGSQAIPSSLVQSTVANERLQFIEQRVLARENLLKLVDRFDLFPALAGEISKTQLAKLVRSQIVITMRASEASEQYAASSVFGIGVNATAPDLAADMAAEIAAMITEENRRARMSRATEATAFLEREVATLKSRVSEFDARLADFVRNHENALPSRLSLHLGDIREGQSELAEVTQSLAEAQSALELLRVELALAASSENTPLREQHSELRTLQATLVARSSVLSPEHHEIRSLKSRVAALKNDIAAGAAIDEPANADAVASPEAQLIARRIQFAEQQMALLEERQAELTARLGEIRQIVAEMPNVEAEFTLLESERASAQRNLDDMSGRLNVARLGQRLETDQQDEQIQILEAPEAPLYASGSSRREYMLAVVGAALALGMGCLYAADTFDPKVRGAFDVAGAAGDVPMVMIDTWKTPAQRRRNTVIATLAIVAILAAGGLLLARYGWPPDGLDWSWIGLEAMAPMAPALVGGGQSWKA